jgi:hypothetical protein
MALLRAKEFEPRVHTTGSSTSLRLAQDDNRKSLDCLPCCAQDDNRRRSCEERNTSLQCRRPMEVATRNPTRGRVMQRVLTCKLILSALFICFLASCGGSSSNGPGTLQFAMTPTAPTLAVNSSITISAQPTPTLPKYYGSTAWSVVGESGGECTQVQPNPECPNGTLAWNLVPTGYQVLQVTYYAPATPGTYQVQVQGEITDSSNPDKIDYQGTGTVTVTVTAQ